MSWFVSIFHYGELTLWYKFGLFHCLGSFSKATCLLCGEKYEGDVIKEDVMAKVGPNLVEINFWKKIPKKEDIPKQNLRIFWFSFPWYLIFRSAISISICNYFQKIARCRKCLEGIIKPDIVFFGEDLSPEFHRQMAEDKHKVDLVVVIG